MRSLVRRFQQNVQDSTFTTMAHLPTMATQIMNDMDVESLISRLQQSRAPRQPLAQPLAPPQLSDPPTSNVSTSARDSAPQSSSVAKSWVEQFSAPSENSLSVSIGEIGTTSAEQSLSLPTHSAPPTTETDVDAQSETGAGATTEFHSLPTDNGDADLEGSPDDAGAGRDELESIIEADINIDPNGVPEQGSVSGRTDTKSDSLMSVPETSSQASGSSADKDSAVVCQSIVTNINILISSIYRWSILIILLRRRTFPLLLHCRIRRSWPCGESLPPSVRI
jgi:hypothetical protein